MNIQQFQYILAVVDFKNFELAAEKCHVTQSTLSTMIGRFEQEIGIKVFNRKTKPVSITKEGSEIIARAKIITNEIDSLQNLVQELKGEITGELKLGVIPTIAPYLLPLFLNDFAEKFPEVTISVKEMTTTEIQTNLKNRNLDVGILALPLLDKELSEVSIYQEPFLVYDCSEKIKTDKIEVAKLDYSKLWLLQEGHCLRTQVSEICDLSQQKKEDNSNLIFESGSMESLLRFTESSKGLTIIPYLASLHLNSEKKERLLQFKHPVPVREVGLITHHFFVKKQLLFALETFIKKATKDLLPPLEKELVISPI